MALSYRLRAVSLDYVGDIQIQVLENSSPARLLWQCELPETQDAKLTLLEAMDDRFLVAVTDKGKVFLGDLGRRQMPQVAELPCSFDSGTWLEPTQQRLWLAGHFRQQPLNGRRLLALDLMTGTLAADWPIDDRDLDLTTLTRRSDGQFAFYGRNSKPGYKFREHWIHSINPDNGEQQRCPLPSKPTPENITVRPWLFQDKARGLALMPAADTLTQVGEDSFAFEVQLLDLNLGEVVWKRVVRHIHLAQVGDEHRHRSLGEALGRIAAGQYAHTDSDAWQTLLSCLTGAWFDPELPEIWLGWQDGTLQKIGLDGQRLSPLYRLGEQTADGGCRTPIYFDHERLVPTGRNLDRLTLAYGFECDEHLEATLPEPVAAAPLEEEPQWLACRPLMGQRLEIPETLQAQPGPSGCVHITTTDLHSAEGRQQALDQLLRLLPALQENLCDTQRGDSGWLGRQLGRVKPRQEAPRQALYLAFSDGLDRTRSEKQFFHEAIHHEGCAPLIARLIDHFSRWPCAARLVGHDGEPPLANATYALCLAPEQLPLLANYFCAIGGGEEVSPFHINRTLAVIREHHAGTPELAAFLATVPWPYNDATFTKHERDPYDDWDEDD